MKAYWRTQNKNILMVWFTILVVMYPILSVYFLDLPFVSLSLADVLMLCSIPLIILSLFWRRMIVYDIGVLLLLVCCMMHFLILMLVDFEVALSSVMDTGHFMLTLVELAIFIPNLFDKKRGLQCLIAVSFISSIFLIFQFGMLNTVGVYVPGQVSFIRSYTATTGNIRPFSFFSEPAAFGWYNSIGLTAVLFSEFGEKNKKYFVAFVISVALVLSTSTTSVGLMAVVWGCWLFHKFRNRLKWMIVATIILSPIIILVEARFGIAKTIFEHSFAGLFSGSIADGVAHRIDGYDYAFEFHNADGVIKTFFGSGMIKFESGDFIPTIGRINIYYGLIGYIILLVFFLNKYSISKVMGKTMILLALISAFFAESVFGLMMLWYMPYVLLDRKEKILRD